jgi:hypothetical protein
VDVIKTRYLSDSGGVYRSPLHCVMATYRSGGIPIFFQVIVPDLTLYYKKKKTALFHVMSCVILFFLLFARRVGFLPIVG